MPNRTRFRLVDFALIVGLLVAAYVTVWLAMKSPWFLTLAIPFMFGVLNRVMDVQRWKMGQDGQQDENKKQAA